MTETLYPEQIELVKYPNAVLRQNSSVVECFDDELKVFCKKLLETMYDCEGVGLAAVQAGVKKQIFVTDHAVNKEEEPTPIIWINPTISNEQGSSVYEEGCLSVPNINSKVKRVEEYDITYFDENGEKHTKHLSVKEDGLLATAVLHELDHLQGNLFIDYISGLALTMNRKKLKALEKEYKKATGKNGLRI